MVVATGPDDTTAVELRTGAFVRLRLERQLAGAAGEASEHPRPRAEEHGAGDPGGGRLLVPEAPAPDGEAGLRVDPEPGMLLPFDVVDATWADDPQRDDLAQPEAVSVSGQPLVVGRLRGRRARGLLKGLVAPPAQQLLGFAGSAAPYWEFHGMRPSVALVVPSRGPLLFRRRADGSVWTRFGWPRIDQWLPVEDRRAVACLWASGQDRLSGRALSTSLGFRPHYLLVAVSRPRQGHCYKTVTALLPRP